MKTRLLYLLLLLLVVACSKKDPEPEPNGPCQLTELKKVGPEPWGNWQLPFYDEQGRLAGIKLPNIDGNPHEEIHIKYDSQGRRAELTHPAGMRFYRVLYQYGANGQPASVLLQYVDGSTEHIIASIRYAFSYNSGKLASITSILTENGQEKEHEKFNYTFSGEQLIKRLSYYPADGTSEREYVEYFTYDNQKRPDYMGMVPQHDSYLNDFLLPTGPNNVASYRLDENFRGNVFTVYSYENTYTYNPQGYPVRQVQKIKDGQENRYTYSYSCP